MSNDQNVVTAKLPIAAAWERVKADIEDREFVKHPYELQLAQKTPEYTGDINLDTFYPTRPEIAEIPKGNGAVRPAALLTMKDRLVYSGAIASMLPAIKAHIGWSQGVVDFAYQLSEKENDPLWIKRPFQGWADFRAKSLELLDSGYSFMIETDITGFYENIDISMLISDLRNLGAPPWCVAHISNCLNKWCLVPNRGIPQGLTASDILAKVYLNSTDEYLRNKGIRHLRYVDDIRIFTKSISEAKEALVLLTQALRRRGLNLQSAKTHIHDNLSARTALDGSIEIIETAKNAYIRRVAEYLNNNNPYLSVSEADVLSFTEDSQLEIEAVKEAFAEYFVSGKHKFNKSLFHFLLNRLGAQKDNAALEYSIGVLPDMPQETSDIIKYAIRCGGEPSLLIFVESLCMSRDYFYDYQMYQLINWLNTSSLPASNIVLDFCRRTLSSTRPQYLRAQCRRYLGLYGSSSDLEQIEYSYASAGSGLEKAQTLSDMN